MDSRRSLRRVDSASLVFTRSLRRGGELFLGL